VTAANGLHHCDLTDLW